MRAGYKTITIPDELASASFGQLTRKQMEMRWQEEHENQRAAAATGITPEMKAMFDNTDPSLVYRQSNK
jgi:hypothetical protein